MQSSTQYPRSRGISLPSKPLALAAGLVLAATLAFGIAQSRDGGPASPSRQPAGAVPVAAAAMSTVTDFIVSSPEEAAALDQFLSQLYGGGGNRPADIITVVRSEEDERALAAEVDAANMVFDRTGDVPVQFMDLRSGPTR